MSTIQHKNTGVYVAGVVYFVVVPLLLVLIFLLSDTFKEFLILYSDAPTFLGSIGSHYLHTDLVHLLSNLSMYLVLMVFIFYFDAQTNRSMLGVNLLLLFFILPLVVSCANLVGLSFMQLSISFRGFSAVVAGLYGYLAFSLLHYIRDYHNVEFTRSIFQMLWSVLYINLALITLIYQFYLGFVVLVFFVVLSFYYTHKDFKKIFVLIASLKNRFYRLPILLGLFLCIATASQALFPPLLVYDTVVVNIFAHYVGYMFGFLVPAVVSIYVIEKKKTSF